MISGLIMDNEFRFPGFDPTIAYDKIRVLVIEPEFRGSVILNVHAVEKCAGRRCVIHKPTSHALHTKALVWRDKLLRMDRLCDHQITHPDPDDLWFKAAHQGWQAADIAAELRTEHDCDGCCITEQRNNPMLIPADMLMPAGLPASGAVLKVRAQYIGAEQGIDEEQEWLILNIDPTPHFPSGWHIVPRDKLQSRNLAGIRWDAGWWVVYTSGDAVFFPGRWKE